MSGNDSELPEGVVAWDPKLTPEQQESFEKRVHDARPKLMFMRQLRDALGLDEFSFAEFLLKDEHADAPPAGSKPVLSVMKIQDFLAERGGSLKLVVTLNGVETVIPS